ncbi:hypothetical protein JAAARDRAFT_144983 [Jaapia argillacea MUCL 33604]|uniref:Ion transport domain-containing protein n=1 Tax=Jaapia argillacea MUCL 33604 TaxID=933084 RepID=A0A067QDY6_9AGAM|nr:hypothetical protein JAAARDRAFT_144983 [Jaapia argillacea MUCL 33604]
MSQPAEGFPDENGSLLSIKSVHPNPSTIGKLVKRLRLLTLALIPVEVDPEIIKDVTSRIITQQVISAYIAAAGDCKEALPYCLLRARKDFMWDANHNPADYGENFGRATACEVLARRIVHQSPPDRLPSIMSTRYQNREEDDEASEVTSALELAIDLHCPIFLSSSEAQHVINALWRGDWIQVNNDNNDIDYVAYDPKRLHHHWGHLHPSRLAVPQYQNFFRIFIWLFFLVVYSQAVREPLDRLDPNHQNLDAWEIILYLMTSAFAMEDVTKFYKLLRYATWRAFGFWNVVSFITDSLLVAAFILRVVGIFSTGDEPSAHFRLKSFQVLSFVAPLIWVEIVTVFDGYKYVGMMQICVARMLRESGIFFALLSVLGLGFAQGLYALDMADGESEHPHVVMNVMIQGLLQSPNFGKFENSPTGLILYYFWSAVTALILLNVLISLFSSAYQDVVDDAEAEYLAFFAGKTVGMIRAPDQYLFPAPFNIIEIFLVAPFEYVLSYQAYGTYNRVMMRVVFFIPLGIIALYESSTAAGGKGWIKEWFGGDEGEDEDTPENRNPQVDEEEGLVISKVPFEELIKVFPNTMQSSEATILKELAEVKAQLDELMKKLEQPSNGVGH